jgi:hypothetical protein
MKHYCNPLDEERYAYSYKQERCGDKFEAMIFAFSVINLILIIGWIVSLWSK